MARQLRNLRQGSRDGQPVTIRGKAKYLGGVGTKVTGIARRKFKPNLQRLRVTVGRGTQQDDAGLHPVHPQRRRDQAGPPAPRSSSPRPKAQPKPADRLQLAAHRLCKARCDWQGQCDDHHAFSRSTFIRMPFMSLSRERCRKSALLGRLRLSPQELDTMTAQLGAIVGYVEQLGGVEHRRCRADGPCRRTDQRLPGRRVAAEPRPAAALANAPHHDGEFYLVPAVLGE